MFSGDTGTGTSVTAPRGASAIVEDCAGPELRIALENGPCSRGEVCPGAPAGSWLSWTGTSRPGPRHTRCEPALHIPGTAPVTRPGWTGLRRRESGHRRRPAPGNDV